MIEDSILEREERKNGFEKLCLSGAKDSQSHFYFDIFCICGVGTASCLDALYREKQ